MHKKQMEIHSFLYNINLEMSKIKLEYADTPLLPSAKTDSLYTYMFGLLSF